MVLESLRVIRERHDVRHLSQIVVDRVAATFGAAPVVCFVRSADQFEPIAFSDCSQSELDAIPSSASLVDRLLDVDVALPIDEEMHRVIFGRVAFELEPLFSRAQAGVIVPVRVDGAFMGFLAVGLSRDRDLTEEHSRELTGLATVIGCGVRLAELASASVPGSHRAQLIQDGELRRNLPRVRGLDYCARYQPAGSVSGDFYDIAELKGGRIALAVGDVSGKGISAALLMANVLERLRQEIRKNGSNLADLILSLHQLIFERSPEGSFVSLFYGLLDLGSLSMRYASAGHQPQAILVQNGPEPRLSRLTEGGPLLGLFATPPATHSFGNVTFYPGDCLIVSTDGIVDATDAEGDMWGEDAYHAAACAAVAASQSAEEVSNRLFQAVSDFVHDAPQRDDMTVLTLRFP